MGWPKAQENNRFFNSPLGSPVVSGTFYSMHARVLASPVCVWKKLTHLYVAPVWAPPSTAYPLSSPTLWVNEIGGP